MNRVIKGLAVLSLVAMVVVLVAAAQPVAADNVNVNVGKVVVLGGTPGTYVSAWQAAGNPADSAGQPIGVMESVTPISPTGSTEIFVPWDQATNLFIWNPNKGYTFLQTVSPSNRGDVITVMAK
jgi:hypothetical protein